MAAMPDGHIWNPIEPKFGVDVEGAQVHIHTRLEHSNILGQIVTKYANFVIVLNFDHCDLER
jgi:hypothetical protein